MPLQPNSQVVQLFNGKPCTVHAGFYFYMHDGFFPGL